ncbi:MAG: hypothetical protein JNN13_18790 [Planctomycetes bacterium]|nr:hypothetical protein [Planctomycetota bacterium]
MRCLPQSWWGRALLVLVVTVGLVAGVDLMVARAGSKAAADVAPAKVAPVVAGRPPLPFRLTPVSGTIVLVEAGAVLRAAAGSHVVVHADGHAELLAGPVAVAHPPYAAVVWLPGALPTLGPAARATLLDVLQQLVRERPVPPSRVALLGRAAPRDLAVLLAWVP